MYAIIRAGGKQYRVKAGDVLRVEKFEGDLGSELKLTDIAFVGGDKNFIGTPVVKDATVTAVVTNQARGPKVVIFKKKRRQGYRRTGGHRQPFTEIFIMSISSPDGQTVKAEGKPQVFSAEKKAQRLMKTQELRLAAKQPGAKKTKAPKAAAAKAPAKKKVAKKKTAKKASSKAGSKKKTSKKA